MITNVSNRTQPSKEWITLALLQLMEKTQYSHISITEITRKAGLARQTFYRNYEDKDDILYEYLCDQYATYWRIIDEQNDLHEDMLVAFFDMWQQHTPPSLLENIWNGDRKVRQIIFRSVDFSIQERFPNRANPENAHHQENLHYYAQRSMSSTFHVILIEWTLRRFRESCDEMGRLAYRLTSSMRDLLSSKSF
ncbi:TetR/AcrR family transcriptional regulator [Brevibacillus sp. 179-C9.3 HS]|uniref:TetR/AcrR family transcriptional regulator n=1 Tax=unclassified Brevibacillus TaxID=2684853 RepID=UPI0039A1A4EC